MPMITIMHSRGLLGSDNLEGEVACVFALGGKENIVSLLLEYFSGRCFTVVSAFRENYY